VACNKAKADRRTAEAGLRLIARPRKPHFLPAVTVRMDETQIPKEWQAYWSVALES
jgi:hypothetical protein